jgi:O-antigen/teichoic acid export membrane protein
MAVVRERRQALQMGLGLVILGAAGYGFIALTGHTLSARDAAAAASYYLIVNMIGPGLFVALEQELSRAVSTAVAVGQDPRPILRRAILAGAGLLGVLLLGFVLVSPVLVPRVLGGHWGLFAAILLGAVTSLAVYLARGLLGGLRLFSGYAATLGIEGLARLLPCLVLAAADAPGAVLYALVFAAGSLLGSFPGVPAARGLRPGGPPAPGSVPALARATVTLGAATLLLQVVANLAPIVVTGRSLDPAPAAAFAAAFVLVRIPVLLMAPVQAMLLPALTAAAAGERWTDLRRTLRGALAGVAALGVLSVPVAWAAGSWVVQLIFGAQVRLPGLVVGLLALSTVAITVTQVLQPALVATGRHRTVATAWLLGAVALAVLLALPGDPVRAAVLAQLAGSVLAVLGMSAPLVMELRRRAA